MSQSSFTILPATANDVEALSNISVQSFKDDTNTQLKEKVYGAGWFADCMTGVIQHYMNRMENPVPGRTKLTVLKTVDDESGKITGHVTWAEQGLEEASLQATGGLKGESTPDAQEAEKSRDKSREEPQKNNGGGQDSTRKTLAQQKVAELEKITSDHMKEWMERIMPEGAKSMFICGISVHPDYQGHGIGKALIQWGTRKADERGVVCWVHLSEAGWGVFNKLGWHVEDSLTVDLDQYAAEPPGESSKGSWGSYTFRYAVRQPCGN